MPIEPAHDKLANALFMIEGAVAEMTTDGICAREIAVALACEMNRQAEIAIGSPEAAQAWKRSLIA